MKVQFKGDAVCTVCLVVALFTMLYSQLGHISVREEKAKGPEKTAAKGSRAFVLQEQSRRTLPMEYARLESQEEQVTSPLLTNTMFDFRLYLQNKDNRKFPLLINQPKKCMKTTEGPFLLIAIKSLVEEFDRREVVRKTWGREGLVTGVQVQRVFLLGIPKNRLVQPTWEAQVHQESHLYHDILLWEFMDTFFNLTLKEINFLSWVDEFCSQTKFIFKGDADVFVNVENIINFAQSCNPSEDLFVGDIIYNAQPIREPQSKYYIPEMMYGLGLYPAYAGGGGFLLSISTLKKLTQACAQVELFPIDDVFLGMCLQRINLKPTLHEGFKTFGILKPSAAPNLQTFDPCFYKDLMVVHGLNGAEIWLMWNLVHSPRLSCAENKQIRKVFRWKRKTKDPLKNYAAEGLAGRLGFWKKH